MHKVLQVCSECYPAAKAGGMGDVVGALPIYLPLHDIEASVIIPKYKTKWITDQKFKKLYSGSFTLDGMKQKFIVEQATTKVVNFPLYCIDLPGLFDRPSIYLAEDGHGYKDEPKRNIAFQTAVVEWLIKSKEKYDLIHVHDHMTGLIPFFMQYCPKYKTLKNIPSVLTVHNGSYTGAFEWKEVESMLPKYTKADEGLLDWDAQVNSLGAAVKCAWSVTTVSPSYMTELIAASGTLTPLYHSEIAKCQGVLNGIDDNLWDPATDSYIVDHYSGNWKKFKYANKAYLQDKFNLYKRRPIIGFIGRFVYQKGADLLMKAIIESLQKKMKFNAIILGSGEKDLEDELTSLNKNYPREVGAYVGYSERLARRIYAGCDFLVMPSRFEPCGLNQLYSMRYGTIPIASHVGGLIDTVVDISKKGQGIVIKELNEDNIVLALERAITLYKDKKAMSQLIESNGNLNHSWAKSAGTYAKLYSKYLNYKTIKND
jgi:starch synthase